MGMFDSMSRAVCSVFDTVTEVGTAAQETVGMGTHFVHNRAVKQRETDKDLTILETAKISDKIAAELDEDENLKEHYGYYQKIWDMTPAERKAFDAQLEANP